MTNHLKFSPHWFCCFITFLILIACPGLRAQQDFGMNNPSGGFSARRRGFWVPVQSLHGWSVPDGDGFKSRWSSQRVWTYVC